MEAASPLHSFLASTANHPAYKPQQGLASEEWTCKYKTELCRNWARGYCYYGDNCLFAHSRTEMRPKQVPKKYKTKLCVNMLRDGYCKYGSRCLFRHQDDLPRHDSDSVTRDNSLDLSGRLPIFVDIEKRCV